MPVKITTKSKYLQKKKNGLSVRLKIDHKDYDFKAASQRQICPPSKGEDGWAQGCHM